MEDADYVVLDQWERDYFDEMWYRAQDYNKPTVTPEFVIDSYGEGRLKDPSNYPTKRPMKPRKDEPRGVGSRSSIHARKQRGRGGARVASVRSIPHPKLPGGSLKWSSSFKETEYAESLRCIGALFEQSEELTYDALAIHLHEKVGHFKFVHRILST